MVRTFLTKVTKREVTMLIIPSAGLLFCFVFLVYYVKLYLKCMLLWLPRGWKIKVFCFDRNRWSIGWVNPIISDVGDNFVPPSGHINTNEIRNHFTLIFFCTKSRALLCSYSNSVLLTLWRYNIGDFEQVATETFSTAVVDREYWHCGDQKVTMGFFSAHAFAVSETQRRRN